MMRIAGFSMVLLLGVPFVSHASDAFGVVSTDGTVACIATSHHMGSFPLKVQVLVPDPPQRVIAGTIVSAL